MANRKSLLSRIWPPRRTSTSQIAAAAPATAAPTPSDKPTSESSASAPQPRTLTRKSATNASSSSPPIPPRTQSRKADQLSSASPQLSKSPSGKTSRATTRSPSSSKPASPSRSSLPQPSSPSSTPKRPSKPLSAKGKLPASPSKGSTQSTEMISTSYEASTLASKDKEPKPATVQQEPEMKEEVKPDSTKVVDGLTQEDKKPSQLSELGNAATTAEGPETAEYIKSLNSSSFNGGHEVSTKLDAKVEEPKDVKEVTPTEANEETKKEVDNSSAPKSLSEPQIVEKTETPGEAEKNQREKQEEALERKVIMTAPEKRSKSHGSHDKSSLPNGEQAPLRINIKAKMSDFANQIATGDSKTAISDKPVSVIMLAGENIGASMKMESDSSKKEAPIHIHRSYKINPNESPEATSDTEEKSEKSGDERYKEDQQMEAYVNNNAQGINNSIVFNSSIVQGNPGVHMVVTHLSKEAVQSKDKTSFPETRKAEVNTSRAEKFTYQPTVRRRCLRGLILETSDSDTENPEKPRRHGCRVGCQKGDTKNNLDVL